MGYILPRMFAEYPRYQAQIPMLIPSRASLTRCFQSSCLDGPSVQGGDSANPTWVGNLSTGILNLTATVPEAQTHQ